MSAHETQDGAVESVFRREERFIVVKRKHLNALQETALRAHMARLDIGTVECVVVESDWPEYQTVWGMIEDRVTGRPAMPDQGKLDDRPDIPGDPLAKVMSYNDLHDDALQLGYPSILEALEDLERHRELLVDLAEALEAALDEVSCADDGCEFCGPKRALLTRARKIGGGE